MIVLDYKKIDVSDAMAQCPYDIQNEQYYRKLLEVNTFDNRQIMSWRSHVNMYAWFKLLTPIITAIVFYVIAGVFGAARGVWLPFLEELVGAICIAFLIFICGVLPIMFLIGVSADVLGKSFLSSMEKSRGFSWTFKAQYLSHTIARAPWGMGSRDFKGRNTGRIVKVKYKDINGDTCTALTSFVNIPVLERMSPGDTIRVSRVYGHLGNDCDLVLIPYFTDTVYNMIKEREEQHSAERMDALMSTTSM